MIATPELAAEANTLEVSFWLRKGTSTAGTFEVGVVSSVTDASSFESVKNITDITYGANWFYFEVQLDDASNGNHYIAFKQVAAGTASYYFDDIDIHELPDCFKPISVSVSNIGQTSADITWVEGLSLETAWNIVISTTPVTDFSTVTPIAVTTPSYSPTDLSPATPYYVYVQADCGASDGASVWTSAITFRTLCGIVTSPFWSDYFDSYALSSIPDCWTQVQANNGFPKIIETDPFNAKIHSRPSSIEFSGDGTQIIATPEFAEEARTMVVSFWLRMSNTDAGIFEVGVISDILEPTSFFPIMDVTPITNTWLPVTVSLAEAPVGNHYIAFRQSTSFIDSYYLDDVEIVSTPIVLPTVVTEPADNFTATSATLHKTVTPGTLNISSEGFKYKEITADMWSNVTTINTDATVNGLTPNTAYEFFAYVISDGEQFTGDTLSFTTQEDAVRVETANADELIIYPNPAGSIATVKIESLYTSARVTITDINGKLIEARTINAGDTEVEFDLANYVDGTYIVRVVSDNINRVEKLIVKK
jgi:hypothetical protein